MTLQELLSMKIGERGLASPDFKVSIQSVGTVVHATICADRDDGPALDIIVKGNVFTSLNKVAGANTNGELTFLNLITFPLKFCNSECTTPDTNIIRLVFLSPFKATISLGLYFIIL